MNGFMRGPAVAALLLLVTAPAPAQDERAPLVSESYALAEAARTAIDAPWLTDAERSALRVFHGVWDERDLAWPANRARVALNAWDFEHASLSDPSVAAAIRAEACLRRGDTDGALAIVEGDGSLAAARIRAEALEQSGQLADAVAATEAPVKSLAQSRADAADLTEGVRALIIRARLQGQPGRDFQTMMDLLGRAHQELDRLHWPATLAEAELLLDKDNQEEAVKALHQTLRLNPRCADAWYALGRVAIARFDFSSAAVAAHALERQHPEHPLALLLLAESQLVEDDPDGALELLAPLVERFPRLRQAHAFVAAAHAIRYDEAALAASLQRVEAISPGSAVPYAVVGRHLSFNRQYEAAAEMLEAAIRRQPAWPAPRIELGLMELQSGREERALEALTEVVRLDPFNKRAANSLYLLQELASYPRIETEHFIIRHAPGLDAVMAEMMPEPLERIHRLVSERFGFEAPRKTVIELLPDHQRFGVRITGMPFIHTVAACTGPVIALEVPREGKPSEHLGLFDWPRVLQHEYTHTITLAQTRNRIPHWFTEAAAVSMEQAPRDHDTCQILAQSWKDGTLFDLDEIKWAFVRPKLPGDRSKAYAQGHWMVEFMNERFGESAMIRLLDRYFHGQREQEAMPAALGVSREEFFEAFKTWAGAQVRAWGLDARPSLTELADRVRWSDPDMAVAMAASQQARLDAIARALSEQVGRPASPRTRGLEGHNWPDMVRPPVEITPELLASWLDQFPDHPDLLLLDLRRRLDEGPEPGEDLVPFLEAYARARPVDPLPHKRLAQVWRSGPRAERAIPHLEELDAREEKSPVYAIELARLYRAAGDLERALAKATRALHFDPYHAPSRERAAEIAIEAGRLEVAHQHVRALTLIEPQRPRHQQRLAALERLMQGGKAD
jgi:tetratricopeptide (TPR) repeat protein